MAKRLDEQGAEGSSPSSGKLLLILGEAAHSNNLILINSWYNILDLNDNITND